MRSSSSNCLNNPIVYGNFSTVPNDFSKKLEFAKIFALARIELT